MLWYRDRFKNNPPAYTLCCCCWAMQIMEEPNYDLFLKHNDLSIYDGGLMETLSIKGKNLLDRDLRDFMEVVEI